MSLLEMLDGGRKKERKKERKKGNTAESKKRTAGDGNGAGPDGADGGVCGSGGRIAVPGWSRVVS